MVLTWILFYFKKIKRHTKARTFCKTMSVNFVKAFFTSHKAPSNENG
jgi:hypothetical protein